MPGMRVMAPSAATCSERQAAVSRPDRSVIAGGDAPLVFVRMRESHHRQRRAPQPVEPGIGGHPRSFPIDQNLPDGVRAESLFRREDFSVSRFHRHRRRPLIHVVKSLHTFAGDRPQRAIRSKSEIAELSGRFAFSPAARRAARSAYWPLDEAPDRRRARWSRPPPHAEKRNWWPSFRRNWWTRLLHTG